MKNKRGISLIVLVITIIVIVVLATAVIVSLARNNPVENANEATFKSDLANIKDAMNLASADVLLQKVSASEAYNDLIPEKYKDILYIENGVLYYTGEDAQEEEWARQIGVLRGEKLPTDWIDIAESTPENGISLLIGKPADAPATMKFKVTSISGYKVEWGDGSNNSYGNEVEASHTYSANNDKSSTDGYLFEVKITPNSGGNITQFEHAQKDASPLLWCQVGCDTLENCESMFNTAINLKRFGTAKETSLSQVKNMWGMFTDCSSLKSIPYFDTSQVINMGDMFYRCSSLTRIPKLNTSNVTYMGGMFGGCSSVEYLPEIDISSATSMDSIFSGCSSLKGIPKLETRKVTDMSGMFNGCSSLKTIPELDTSQVTDMDWMFKGCSNLTSVPDLDTSKVEEMEAMFQGCSSLKTIPLLNTSQVTNMDSMFRECSNLISIPQLDTSKVTYMPDMFSGCSSLENISIANTNLTNTQINNVFDELPPSTKNAVIDITGNPGESSCTRVTATGKGWIVKP